jgi:glycosyltransferase involved in cell wall biosynthesis
VVEALARCGPIVEARFIGAGTMKSQLMHQASTLRAGISFEGMVSGEDLWAAYRWADTCLVPLRAHAPFRYTVPSKVYEIMACGRHITAAVEGEAADILAAAHGGISVPSEDPSALAAALSALAQHRKVAMGIEPRHWVEAHGNAITIAERYWELVSKVSRPKVARAADVDALG